MPVVIAGSAHSVSGPGLGIPGTTPASTAPPNSNAATRTTTAVPVATVTRDGAFTASRTHRQSPGAAPQFPAGLFSRRAELGGRFSRPLQR